MKFYRTGMIAMATMAVMVMLSVAPVRAHEDEGAAPGHMHGQEAPGHSHEKASAHGGSVAMTQAFHFETVVLPDQLRVYAYDGSQNPVNALSGTEGPIKGTVEIQFRDPSRKPIKLDLKAQSPAEASKTMGAHETGEQGHMEGMDMSHDEHGMMHDEKTSGSMEHRLPVLWSCPMHPDQVAKSMGKCPKCGMKLVPQGYLAVKVDLKNIKPNEAKATFRLSNLPSETEKEVTFTQKLEPAKPGHAHHGDEAEHHEDKGGEAAEGHAAHHH